MGGIAVLENTARIGMKRLRMDAAVERKVRKEAELTNPALPDLRSFLKKR